MISVSTKNQTVNRKKSKIIFQKNYQLSAVCYSGVAEGPLTVNFNFLIYYKVTFGHPCIAMHLIDALLQGSATS